MRESRYFREVKMRMKIARTKLVLIVALLVAVFSATGLELASSKSALPTCATCTGSPLDLAKFGVVRLVDPGVNVAGSSIVFVIIDSDTSPIFLEQLQLQTSETPSGTNFIAVGAFSTDSVIQPMAERHMLITVIPSGQPYGEVVSALLNPSNGLQPLEVKDPMGNPSIAALQSGTVASGVSSMCFEVVAIGGSFLASLGGAATLTAPDGSTSTLTIVIGNANNIPPSCSGLVPTSP